MSNTGFPLKCGGVHFRRWGREGFTAMMAVWWGVAQYRVLGEDEGADSRSRQLSFLPEGGIVFLTESCIWTYLRIAPPEILAKHLFCRYSLSVRLYVCLLIRIHDICSLIVRCTRTLYLLYIESSRNMCEKNVFAKMKDVCAH